MNEYRTKRIACLKEMVSAYALARYKANLHPYDKQAQDVNEALDTLADEFEYFIKLVMSEG